MQKGKLILSKMSHNNKNMNKYNAMKKNRVDIIYSIKLSNHTELVFIKYKFSLPKGIDE